MCQHFFTTSSTTLSTNTITCYHCNIELTKIQHNGFRIYVEKLYYDEEPTSKLIREFSELKIHYHIWKRMDIINNVSLWKCEETIFKDTIHEHKCNQCYILT